VIFCEIIRFSGFTFAALRLCVRFFFVFVLRSLRSFAACRAVGLAEEGLFRLGDSRSVLDPVLQDLQLMGECDLRLVDVGVPILFPFD
jgi:hypothetical protein